jgi:hypothetical protein
MIAWAIETAMKSQCFDFVLVSTDDEEIKEVATQYGVLVPFSERPNFQMITPELLGSCKTQYKDSRRDQKCRLGLYARYYRRLLCLE